MSIPQLVTVYTVRRTPYTAAAKRSAGYEPHEFEFVAGSAKEASEKAAEECEWRDATRNFSFQTVSSRVVTMEEAS